MREREKKKILWQSRHYAVLRSLVEEAFRVAVLVAVEVRGVATAVSHCLAQKARALKRKKENCQSE